MVKNFLHLVDVSTIHLDETNPETPASWIHALPIGDYTHPRYGGISLTAERIKKFVESVKNKVRGIDPSINYNHNNEDVASGWVKDAKSEANGLWLFVEWTKAAAKKIKDKEFRYFSAEYADSWKNPQGVDIQDVIIGGALTNRPWMKDLLPINLSEDTIDIAIGLAEAIKKAKEAETGEDMDLKKLVEMLGLPVGTSESDAFSKLSELVKTPAPPTPPNDKPASVPDKLNFPEELKKLSEENPIVKALMENNEAMHKSLQEHNKQLRESEINKKLAEFDQTKIILSPSVKDLVHDFLMDSPIELHERFWDILSSMKTNAGLLVELGERGGVNPTYGRSKNAEALFLDEVNKYMAEHKVDMSKAMDEVSRNAELYQGYRQNSYAFKE